MVHAFLCLFDRLSLFIAALFESTAGFSFSAGLVDYPLSLAVSIANQPCMLLLQESFFAVLYYFEFRFLIQKFDLKTPDRDEEMAVQTEEGGGIIRYPR